MTNNARPGTVIFATDHRHLANFYAALTDLPVHVADDPLTPAHLCCW